MLKITSFSFCPKDSHESIKEIADHILPRNGGDGVIIELLEVLLNG